MTYAFSENFVLPLSHDEVVHGKSSMINKMPGELRQKLANLRAFYGYMMVHPGKKLMFMGNEFAQTSEWDFKKELDWKLLAFPDHKQMQRFVKDLNHFYLENPPLWQKDDSWDGFQWIVADDKDQSIVALRRIDNKGDEVIVVCNFCPVTREKYRIGVPYDGSYTPVLNSDDIKYGGSGEKLKTLKSKKVQSHGMDYSIELHIPPMSTVFYKVTKAVASTAKKPIAKKVVAGKKNSAPAAVKNNQTAKSVSAPAVIEKKQTTMTTTKPASAPAVIEKKQTAMTTTKPASAPAVVKKKQTAITQVGSNSSNKKKGKQ